MKREFLVAGKLGPWARRFMPGTRYLNVGRQDAPDYRLIVDTKKDGDTWRYVRVLCKDETFWHSRGCGTNTYQRIGEIDALPLDFDEYQQTCRRTWNSARPASERRTNAALGLAAEAGESADMIKKILFHGHEFDRDALIDELGDPLYYVATLALEFGIPLSLIAQRNVEKLRARYPNGFSEQDSRERKA